MNYVPHIDGIKYKNVLPLFIQYRAMVYSNNGIQNESNDDDDVLRYWGVSNNPRTFTNIVSTGIDKEER